MTTKATSRLLAAALLGLAKVASSHSHVTNFVINEDSYGGFHPQLKDNPKILAAWATEVVQDGWVGVDSYGTPDIICHVNATNALGYATVKAGSTLQLQWQGWPESHHGPVLTYMAYCGTKSESCATINKTDLKFFETDRAGLVNPNEIPSKFPTADGLWGDDMVILNNASWVTMIPPTLAPGFYVLRHEIIALHYALLPDLGPQHYPQCITLEVIGNGTAEPQGIPGTKLYHSGEAGLIYNISQSPLPPYTIPGPTLWSGAKPLVSQTPMTIIKDLEATPADPTQAALVKATAKKTSHKSPSAPATTPPPHALDLRQFWTTEKTELPSSIPDQLEERQFWTTMKTELPSAITEQLEERQFWTTLKTELLSAVSQQLEERQFWTTQKTELPSAVSQQLEERQFWTTLKTELPGDTAKLEARQFKTKTKDPAHVVLDLEERQFRTVIKTMSVADPELEPRQFRTIIKTMSLVETIQLEERQFRTTLKTFSGVVTDELDAELFYTTFKTTSEVLPEETPAAKELDERQFSTTLKTFSGIVTLDAVDPQFWTTTKTMAAPTFVTSTSTMYGE